MLRLLVLAALASVALAAFFPSSVHSTVQNRLAFDAWMRQYSKQYASPQERLRRLQIFVDNVAYINAFNAAGNASYTLAVNEYADLTHAEFVSMMNGFKAPAQAPRDTVSVFPDRPEVTCPSNGTEYTCDWRLAGVVTPIKNQGQCGSCWAFSAVASTEGAHALATKKLVSLSEQNLVDCSTKEGNMGCNGGLMDQAFEYVIQNKGIDTEASYPYTGTDDKCKFKAANVGATLASYKNVAPGNEAALQQAIQNVGPISVAIDASETSFQFYSKGVYYSAGCSSSQLDHGVTAVGFGVLGSSKFYLVKNSWGTSWGMGGYILMSRDRNNNCGIATMASYPIVPTL